MFEVLILRLEAPILAMGAPSIDEYRVISPYPATSMLCGMLANALGYDHSDWERLQSLQERLQWAAFWERRPQEIRDYQTVDLSQPHLNMEGWTSWGIPEKREGGSSTGTHIRHKDYWADGSMLVFLLVEPSERGPSLAEITSALRSPARPLFIGRRTCLPSVPIYEGSVKGSSLKEVVECYIAKKSVRTDVEIWMTQAAGESPDLHSVEVTDRRDWQNQQHVGQRFLSHWVYKAEFQAQGEQ